MRPIFLFLLVAGVGIVAWLLLARPEKKAEAARQAAVPVSAHSTAFNESVGRVLTGYGELSEAFVNWDSVAAGGAAQRLQKMVDSLNIDELKKDSAAIHETALSFAANAKADLQTIAAEKGIRPQREAFNSLSDNLYQLLNTVRYDRETLYLQQCPMAFDDTETARWLSRAEKIRNPYLGVKDPKYGRGMLSCGEVLKTMQHAGGKQ